MQLLAALLQRDTHARTQQLLDLAHAKDVKGLMQRWLSDEEREKSKPISEGWGNTLNLVQPLLNLINSVLKHGILSPMEAGKRGLRVVRSIDKGASDSIALNTFALMDNTLVIARKLAHESMGLENRGSISVSFERNNDMLLKKLLSLDTSLPEDVMEELRKKAKEVEKLLPNILDSLIKNKKENKAFELSQAELNGPSKGTLNTRAIGTIMAILDQRTTGKSSSNVDMHTGKPNQNSSQETGVETQIKTGHILELLLPDFIRPYFDKIVNPADIPIRFVGVTSVDAHYKTSDGHLQIKNVIAPDYVESIARKLTEQRVISTHIVTTDAEQQPSGNNSDKKEPN